MKHKKDWQSKIFSIKTHEQFNETALEVFAYQFANNPVYRKFCKAIHVASDGPGHYTQIPFMPVEFFKNHTVITKKKRPRLVFASSGTTGGDTSKHYVERPELYRESFTRCFRMFFGDPADYHILALLPGYLERSDSSLVYMVNELIELSDSSHSGFYLDELEMLQSKIEALHNDSRKIILMGVSFALLDMAETYPVNHPGLLVMETGGMKGRRKELIREELHELLCKGFKVEEICSEYGMTELLSQAYSMRDGVFYTPPWMKIIIRETNDPFSYASPGKTGGINVIDLANIYSCSFIATKDLGKIMPDGGFEISGRFDDSDVRGCNLLVS